MDKSCWTCNYMMNGGTYFPGVCKWWIEDTAGTKKEESPKQIPNKTMDKGCKFWIKKEK